MTPYRNLNGDSAVISYETTEDSIHVVFKSGAHRNYLYDYSRPGKSQVDQMKFLASQGHGLCAFINKSVKSYSKKW